MGISGPSPPPPPPPLYYNISASKEIWISGLLFTKLVLTFVLSQYFNKMMYKNSTFSRLISGKVWIFTESWFLKKKCSGFGQDFWKIGLDLDFLSLECYLEATYWRLAISSSIRGPHSKILKKAMIVDEGKIKIMTGQIFQKVL